MRNEGWDAIYGNNKSSRFRNEGDIGIYYRLPKFIEMFKIFFSDIDGLKILEIGSGIGETYDLIETQYKGQNYDYVLTEYSLNAVLMLREKYRDKREVFKADALDLPFADDMFDIVCCFDVMHHVSDPSKMAAEMLRVSRKNFFLCEANGLSIIRRIGERSKEAQRLEEKSYFPWQYRSFFVDNGAVDVEIVPFYFFVPPKVKKENMRPFIFISELGQKLPVLKWQSQSLCITGKKLFGSRSI